MDESGTLALTGQIEPIGDIQQSIRDNLFGAFDVNKLQAAFDILFGIIAKQQNEIDKFNNELSVVIDKQGEYLNVKMLSYMFMTT
jgi:hypothetical protein